MKALILTLSMLMGVRAAADPMIFDMRKNLRMADSDPVYHDYYVNAGTEVGMSAGTIITVTRRLPLYDTYQNHSAGDLLLKVAKVKIIATQKGLSVARLQSEFARDNAPLLEDNFIMVGDTLDMSTATAEKKSADNSDSKAPEPVAQPSAPQDKPVAQISVNSVDLSSSAGKQPAPVPAPVANPSLQ